jgi:hypothetical protein
MPKLVYDGSNNIQRSKQNTWCEALELMSEEQENWG